MTHHLIRRYSTRSIVDQWFQAIQSRESFQRCFEQVKQLDSNQSTRLVHEIIERWRRECPGKEALWLVDRTNQSHRFTWNDIFHKARQWGNALCGPAVQLAPGNNILVVLSRVGEERIVLELMCLQRNLIHHVLLERENLREMLRLLAIDCIITDLDHLEWIHQCTYNAFRPLKKVLVSDQNLDRRVLPVGWIHLNDHLKNENFLRQEFLLGHPRSFSYLLHAFWLAHRRPPRLIWMKEMKLSLSSWLLGSTLFFREIPNDLSLIIKTFQTYPIDTFCASNKDYQLLDRDHPTISTHLEQLLSIDTIEHSSVKQRWKTLTKLWIDDGQSADSMHCGSLLPFFKDSALIEIKELSRV